MLGFLEKMYLVIAINGIENLVTYDVETFHFPENISYLQKNKSTICIIKISTIKYVCVIVYVAQKCSF